MDARPVDVVIVDDHQMVLDGLVAMLTPQAGRVRVVGQANDGARAAIVVRSVRPQVVLLDVRLGSESGLDVCRALLDEHPDLAVVFLTVYDDEQYLVEAMRLGASGFLLKQVTGAELADAVCRVATGEMVVDPSLGQRVALTPAALLSGEFWPGAHLGLTQRESEILDHLVQGQSNREIAAELYLGEETVKTHVSAVYRKLGVKDRAQAVLAALRGGLYR